MTHDPQPSPPAAAAIRVALSNTQAQLDFDAAWFDRIVREFCRAEQIQDATIAISLVDNASIRSINARYLGHDWATDVISFPDADASPGELAGDLVISTEMARETARSVGSEAIEEVALYLVHGLLHLKGYDDQSHDDVQVMRRRETEILGRIAIRNPFDRVVRVADASQDPGRESVRWPR